MSMAMAMPMCRAMQPQPQSHDHCTSPHMNLRSSFLLLPHSQCPSPFLNSLSCAQSQIYSIRSIPHPFNWTPARRRPRSLTVKAMAAIGEKSKKVLVVNTNSGGHAIIGFWFAKDLISAGHQVTVFTVGEEASEKMTKPPFSRFSELRDIGVQTTWGKPAEIGKIFESTIFDAVLDNNGKDLDSVKPVADWAKTIGANQFLYISSAGIYKPTDEPPHVEGDIVKADASHVAVEDYLRSLSFNSWCTFRPQYMIGSGNNKDCEEWFFDLTTPSKDEQATRKKLTTTEHWWLSVTHHKDHHGMSIGTELGWQWREEATFKWFVYSQDSWAKSETWIMIFDVQRWMNTYQLRDMSFPSVQSTLVKHGHFSRKCPVLT